MAEGLILEFEGVGLDMYNAVSERLGVEPARPRAGPTACSTTPAAPSRADSSYSRSGRRDDAQQAFMDERLGAALQEAGVTGPPARAEWLELGGYASAEG